MFTGIITDIATVISVQAQAGGRRFVLQTSAPLHDLAIGASVAHSGVCLTVVEKQANGFAVDVSDETLRVTHIGNWKQGTQVNLERALKVGDELGGHIVSGHVDGLGTITGLEKRGDNYKLIVKAPEALKPFIAEKGSVTLDGVSLTINKVGGDIFEINLIPHTWQNTTFRENKTGDSLHIEVDMLARYMMRMLEVKSGK